jgi:hypothetical protein
MAQGVSPQSATLANVASSATNVTLFAAATGHVNGRAVFNDSTAVLYLKFGATASTSSYTVQLASNGYYEFPAEAGGVYAGQVDGIWASANGNARTSVW